MDDHGVRDTHRSPLPTARRSTKGKAPPPPLAARGFDGPGLPHRPKGLPQATMEQKENLVEEDLTLAVVLPGGQEKTATVPGSVPMMDLLVTLCAKYHLNPSSHTIELTSANRNHIKFKPNALIGTLEAEKVLLKPKGSEDKNRKTGPQMPEATVRLIINYKKTQKTILRVNPQIPLEEIMPAVCEKCEFDQKTTVLLRDVWSAEPLDLTKSLSDFCLKEVYAKDTKGLTPASWPDSPSRQEDKVPQSKNKVLKEKENRGWFSMFRKSKKKPDQASTASAPSSPVLSKQRPGSVTSQTARPCAYSSNTLPSDVPKKRRAPLPPLMVSQSFPSRLGEPQNSPKPKGPSENTQAVPGLSRKSSGSSLKTTKRKAPPPPAAVSQEDTALDRQAKVVQTSQNVLKEINEQEKTLRLETLGSKVADEVRYDNRPNNVTVDSGVTAAPTDVEMQNAPLAGGTGDLSPDGRPAWDPVSNKENPDGTLEAQEPNTGGAEPKASDWSSEEGEMKRGLLTESSPVLCENGVRVSLAPAVSSTARPVTQETGVQPEEESSSGDQSEAPSPPPLEVSSPGPAVLKTEGGSVSAQAEAAHQCQTARATNGTLFHTKTESKPSKDHTADHKPNAGLTKCTVVPLKNPEKQRFFEVELTLESPSVVVQQDVSVYPPGPIDLQTRTSELRGSSPGYGSQLSNGSVANDDSRHGSAVPAPPAVLPEWDGKLCDSPTSPDRVGLATQVKEKKMPPALKPKPGSFRLVQNQPMPGSLVTSSAVKDPISCPGRDASRTPGTPAEPAVDCSFPLPQPPVDGTGVAGEYPWSSRPPEAKALGSRIPGLVRQQSVPSKEPRAGLSLEKLRTFAAPRPYTSTAPSRFALAVSSKVRRSQSFTRGSSSPPTPGERKEARTNVEYSTLGRKGLTMAELRRAEHPIVDRAGDPSKAHEETDRDRARFTGPSLAETEPTRVG